MLGICLDMPETETARDLHDGFLKIFGSFDKFTGVVKVIGHGWNV